LCLNLPASLLLSSYAIFYRRWLALALTVKGRTLKLLGCERTNLFSISKSAGGGRTGAQVFLPTLGIVLRLYVSPQTLETVSLRCRGSILRWNNESTLLETAVCRQNPDEASVHLKTAPWILKHKDCYSMGMFDSLLRVLLAQRRVVRYSCLIRS